MTTLPPRVPDSALARTPSVTLPPYLYRRGTTYYFKRRIPADCRDAMPHARGQVWKSLDTNLLERAKVRLAVEVTEFDLTIAQCRRDKASRLAGVQTLKAGAATTQTGVSSGASLESLDPLAVLRAVEESLERLRQLTGGAQSERRSEQTKPPVVERKAAPVAAPKTPATRGLRPTLLHLFEDWKLKQTKSRTICAVQAAVMEFRTLTGPLAVEDITRQHARGYRDHLIERRLANGTIENRIGFLSTLVRHGRAEMVEHLTANPFENIAVSGGQGLRAEKERRAYDISELNQLYSSRLYTQGYRPKGQVAEAAYWAPLLGPFLGARIEEVAQLRIQDVQRINGMWCIRICDLGEAQSVKNVGSFRRVPLHETVMRCGFLAYVAQQARAGHERVFPSLSNENANRIWSNSLGKWYGRYLDSIGLHDHRLDYHSFRYTFRQQCSLSGIDNEVRDALTGHWVSNVDSGRTYMKAENKQYPFPKLVDAVTQLRYDELRISHLFVPQPMALVEEALLR